MNRERVIEAGIDYDNGVRRFMGKPQTYEKYLMKFFEQNAITDLQSQLETGDYETAFSTAHGMKGVCGNLSMGRLYELICELSEFLRAGGGGGDAQLLYEQIKELYDTAWNAVNE